MASNKDEGKSRLASQPLPPPQLSKAAPELVATELASNPSPDERARSLITTGEADTGTATAAAAPPPCAHEKPEGNSATKRGGLASPLPPPPTTIAGMDVTQQKIEADKRRKEASMMPPLSTEGRAARGTWQRRSGGMEASSPSHAEECGASDGRKSCSSLEGSHLEARVGRNDASAANDNDDDDDDGSGGKDWPKKRQNNVYAAKAERARQWKGQSASSPNPMSTGSGDIGLGDDVVRIASASASEIPAAVGGVTSFGTGNLPRQSNGHGNGHGNGNGDDDDDDVMNAASISYPSSHGASSSYTPGAYAVQGMLPSSSVAAGMEALVENRPNLSGLEIMDPSGIGLVSAQLVVENSDDDSDHGSRNVDNNDGEQTWAYGFAEEISPWYCYIGKRRIHRCFVLLVIVLVAAAIALPVTLTARNRPNKIKPVHPDATCGGGARGNGLCLMGECCSAFGYCGDSPEYCAEPPGGLSFNGTSYGNATIGPIWSDKICGGYYIDWNSFPSVRNIHPNYNLVNLFAARLDGAEGGDGAGAEKAFGSITYVPPYDMATFRADMAAERMSGRNRTFLLTVGGTNSGFEVSDRSMSLTFLDSFSRIRDEVGRLDGLDWDAFKDRETNTTELIWIGKELKSLYPNFTVSASVVPTRGRDRRFCRKAIDEDALDFCTPVFYGGPGLSSHSDIMDLLADWVESLGQDRVVVGLGVHPTESYFQLSDEAKEIYAEIKSLYPDIRGALNWNVQNDFSLGTGFAEDICTV